MAEGADVIVGAVLMDNIVYADGSRRDDIPGGAGLYALAGAALFSDEAVLVTGTGRDLPVTFGPWLERNGLTTRGLRFADDHAPRNILRYIDERTRTEAPVYGAEHFRRIEPTAGDIARVIPGARSLFLFRNLDPGFWAGVLPLMAEHRPVTLWEMALDACLPQNRPRIEELARLVDALSINLEEARLIYGSSDEAELIVRLRAIGTSVVFLRAGARGSFVITPDQTRFVPSLAIAPVDVTGGGNAFGGAAVVGLAEGLDSVRCAAMGTVAARLAIAQHGPPESGAAETRNTAKSLVAELMTTLEQTA
jgi:sugar/nucleoside kinase (ribokinase family)